MVVVRAEITNDYRARIYCYSNEQVRHVKRSVDSVNFAHGHLHLDGAGYGIFDVGLSLFGEAKNH